MYYVTIVRPHDKGLWLLTLARSFGAKKPFGRAEIVLFGPSNARPIAYASIFTVISIE